MSDHDEQAEPLSDLPGIEKVDAEHVRGGFNPQPDPPKMLKADMGDGSALLLPAVQKVRDAAGR